MYENYTEKEEVLNSFNNITPRLNFTLELEKDNKLNFLELTITKTNKNYLSTYTGSIPPPTPLQTFRKNNTAEIQ